MENLLNQMVEQIEKCPDHFTEDEKIESIIQLKGIFRKLYGIGSEDKFTSMLDFGRYRLISESAIDFLEKENGYKKIGLAYGIPTKKLLINFIKASTALKGTKEMDGVTKKIIFDKLLDKMEEILRIEFQREKDIKETVENIADAIGNRKGS